ncbi:nitrite reductase [Daedalea quercina L-15889]|uniref:Nitrite reductase [NAD(P)H] n=1 Tax=Daedalea quercina L-15889 TaxID=1314783 RepID=A0A165PQ28_9APHY|nr:nitrite reductase [Daedalea quercina L-15889]
MSSTEGRSSRKTVFVVGLGMVGIAFIEKLLNLDAACKYRIVTCGEETHLAYNRVALTEYFQHRSVEKLYLNSPDWYAKQDPDRFSFYVGETVTKIDTDAHVVVTDKGREVEYDYCVIATGSEATLPGNVSKTTPGLFVYRNVADMDSLLAYSEKDGVKSTKAAVLGAGLLGLEAAKAVYDLNTIKDVTIIHRQAYPLSRQLDNHGGEIVRRRIEAMGVTFLGSISVQSVITSDSGVLNGLELTDGTVVPCDIAVVAIGITPRGDLARASGITCTERHGIVVDDSLRTSAPDVFAIGECASWRNNTYGLIAPGVEMADILAFNLTQTQTDVGEFKPRKMNNPDLSTKLKLMGVDVASFGDYFAENRSPKLADSAMSVKLKKSAPANSEPISWNQRDANKPPVWEVAPGPIDATSPSLTVSKDTASPSTSTPQEDKNSPSPTTSDRASSPKADASAPKKRHAHGPPEDGPTETLTYRDPFAGVYKKYIFTADGKYLLGGMMVGDTSDYIKLVALVKKKKALDVPPSQFILGARKAGDDSGADLDDDAQICSCHNVSKGDIIKCVRQGAQSVGDVKAKTKAGSGCGGCLPFLTNIFKAEMKRTGHSVSNYICPHYNMSRADLFNVVRIKKLKTFTEIMETLGVNRESVGCEVCKPAIGSILSSLWNEHVMNPVHHSNQDTNDRFMANIQRNGTFSVVPRVAAGEITPDKLIVLGQVAKKYGLYSKITGGQRVDLFGAQKADLPSIWKELIDAGFESGHAYGKALRTVKSCVGTNWCRYGIGDSVGMAVQLEERYKGIRSPHKIKGGVSGCVRECAEAQGKDFGLIATDKGWNIFLCGNGGVSPRHATLFACDVPPSKVIQILDRFLMYYIRTADKLMRTSRWLEDMEGGIEKLRRVILDDELGICEDLEKGMEELVGTYYDEWKAVVDDPERQKQFRQFVNTTERRVPVEQVLERGQPRPADWAKSFPPAKLREDRIKTPKEQWRWRTLAKSHDLIPTDAGTTSVAAKYGDSQLAIFHVPRKGYFATQQMCPHKRAFVLEHGIIGDDPNSGKVYISCPMHKRNFTLRGGDCLNDDAYSILTFDVRVEGDDISLLLPEAEELDELIGTSKWMVKRQTAGIVNKGLGDGVEVSRPTAGCDGQSLTAACGGDPSLEW